MQMIRELDAPPLILQLASETKWRLKLNAIGSSKSRHNRNFPISQVLESVVKGFTPEILGYTSLRKFAKNQPKKFMRFDKKENMCHPPKE